MLGRLVRWLRLLGYDAVYHPEIGDWEMLRQCAAEGRILLTRDRRVMERWQIGRGQVRAALIGSDKVEEQLKEAAARFGLEPQPEPRCPEDNAVLLALPHEKARDRVPPYVYQTQTSFRSCPGCGRVYWQATHWRRIEAMRGSISG